MPYRYVYLGTPVGRAFAAAGWPCTDRTGQRCDPVRRPDGTCIVSQRFSSALVRFEDNTLEVVNRRRLRLTTGAPAPRRRRA